jgi:hypothetical protein
VHDRRRVGDHYGPCSLRKADAAAARVGRPRGAVAPRRSRILLPTDYSFKRKLTVSGTCKLVRTRHEEMTQTIKVK